ncbi:MAG: hypothetical protein LIP02_04175 [Bacteroidales bacterium]|nr:hypothetical protein [Bacteroidales bacterium]
MNTNDTTTRAAKRGENASKDITGEFFAQLEAICRGDFSAVAPNAHLYAAMDACELTRARDKARDAERLLKNCRDAVLTVLALTDNILDHKVWLKLSKADDAMMDALFETQRQLGLIVCEQAKRARQTQNSYDYDL